MGAFASAPSAHTDALVADAIPGNLGQHLQTFDGGIRDRLRALYPKSG